MFKKKLLGAALSLAMAAGSVAPVLASTGFSDVKDADSIASAVQRLNSLGIMQGTKNADGTYAFNGEGTFTRAQAAKVFVVAKGLSKVTSKTGVFKDVAKDNWAYSYVNVANQYGIVNGTSETTFAPTKEVTYGQLAAMAIRTLGYTEEDLDGSTFPYNYVQKAAELNLLDSLDAVDVDAPATRADVANVVNALLNTPTKTQQTAMDTWSATTGKDAATSADYAKSKSFFDSVAVKFGVKAITGTTFTATSASDSSLKANQFKVGTDATVYTLPTSEDFSGNFYKTYGGQFYVSTKDTTKVVMFDASKISGSTKTITGVSSTVAGYVYDSATTPVATDVSKVTKLVVNGAVSSIALKDLKDASNTVDVTLVDTTADGTYDAVVATRTNNPVMVTTAPTSNDIAASQKTITVSSGTINLMKDATTAASVYVTGAATKLTEIKVNDIIYVKTTDGNEAVTLDVFRSPVTGTVTFSDVANTKVTVAGVAHSLANGWTLAKLPLGAKGTYVVDKSGAVWNFTSDADSATASAPTVGGAVYGIVTAAADTSKDAWGAATLPKVKLFKLDGTTVEITTPTYRTDLVNKFAYYTTLDTTNGTAFTLVKDSDKVSLNSSNVAKDTVIVKLDASNVPSIVKASDVTAPANGTSVWAAAKNGNTMGDYYAVVYVNPATPAPATTTVGYVQTYLGQETIGTVTADVYNVFENGTAKVVKATAGLLTEGIVYTGLTTGTDGVTTAVAKATIVANNATAASTASIDTVSIIDAASSRIKFATAGIKTIASNVVVIKYAAASKAVGSLSDVVANDSVKFYLNSDGNVVLILVNK